MEHSDSPKWKLNLIDVYKAVRGGLVVFASAFVAEFIVQARTLIDTGVMPTTVADLTMYVKIAVASTIVELGRRFLTEHQQ